MHPKEVAGVGRLRIHSRQGRYCVGRQCGRAGELCERRQCDAQFAASLYRALIGRLVGDIEREPETGSRVERCGLMHYAPYASSTKRAPYRTIGG